MLFILLLGFQGTSSCIKGTFLKNKKEQTITINMNQCNSKISHSCLVLHIGWCFIHSTHSDNATFILPILTMLPSSYPFWQGIIHSTHSDNASFILPILTMLHSSYPFWQCGQCDLVKKTSWCELLPFYRTGTHEVLTILAKCSHFQVCRDVIYVYKYGMP